MARTDWATLREAYEAGLSMSDLCDSFGLARSTIERRAKREGWRGGHEPITGAVPGIAEPCAAPGRSARPRKRTMTARLYAAMETTMSKLEERLASDATPAERERDAKLLTALATLYEKLKGMNPDRQPRSRASGGNAGSDSLRDELAARLESLHRRACP
jgi:hypothetical protein